MQKRQLSLSADGDVCLASVVGIWIVLLFLVRLDVLDACTEHFFRRRFMSSRHTLPMWDVLCTMLALMCFSADSAEGPACNPARTASAR